MLATASTHSIDSIIHSALCQAVNQLIIDHSQAGSCDPVPAAAAA